MTLVVSRLKPKKLRRGPNFTPLQGVQLRLFPDLADEDAAVKSDDIPVVNGLPERDATKVATRSAAA